MSGSAKPTQGQDGSSSADIAGTQPSRLDLIALAIIVAALVVDIVRGRKKPSEAVDSLLKQSSVGAALKPARQPNQIVTDVLERVDATTADEPAATTRSGDDEPFASERASAITATPNLQGSELEATLKREQVIKEIAQATSDENASLAVSIRSLSRIERRIFWLRLATAVLTVILAVIGVLLVFLGRTAVGAVSAAIAILPGVGTVSLNRLGKELERKVTAFSSARDANTASMHAIRLMQSEDDPVERKLLYAKFIADLRRKASQPVSDTPSENAQ